MSTRIIIVWGKDKTVLGYAAYRTNSREGGKQTILIAPSAARWHARLEGETHACVAITRQQLQELTANSACTFRP